MRSRMGVKQVHHADQSRCCSGRSSGSSSPQISHHPNGEGASPTLSIVAYRSTANYNRVEIGNIGEVHNLEGEPWPILKAKALTLKI